MCAHNPKFLMGVGPRYGMKLCWRLEMILQNEVKACAVRISKGRIGVCRIDGPAADNLGQPLGWLPLLWRSLVRDKVKLLQPDPVQGSKWTPDCKP